MGVDKGNAFIKAIKDCGRQEMNAFKRLVFKILGLKKCDKCGRPMKKGKKGCHLCIDERRLDTYNYIKDVFEIVNKHFMTHEEKE